MAGGTGLECGRQYTQATLVLVHCIYHACGQVGVDFFILIGTTQNFIVDIGDVADVINVPILRTQVACNRIEGNQHTSMANMAVVIL